MSALCGFCLFTLSSCAEMMQLSQVAMSGAAASRPITEADNVNGLKSALNLGIEQAVARLGAENGFFGDQLLKLVLPSEAQVIVNNLRYIPNGQDLVDKAVLALNRAAEDAVQEAGPIFKKAIREMSITDAAQILFGNENAATSYLRAHTYTDLAQAFAPKVSKSLSKPLVAGVSTSESWNALTSAYNTVANSLVGQVARLTPVNVSLESYVTEKALDALFSKIEVEEKALRTDPAARVSTILQRVFGQLDKK